jgi:hypothetical protein
MPRYRVSLALPNTPRKQGSLTMTIGLLLAHRFTSDTNCGWAVWYWTDMPDAHGRRTFTLDHISSLRCCFHRQAACVSQEVFDSACAQAFGNGAKQRIESVLIGCGHPFLTGHRRQAVVPVFIWLMAIKAIDVLVVYYGIYGYF